MGQEYSRQLEQVSHRNHFVYRWTTMTDP